MIPENILRDVIGEVAGDDVVELVLLVQGKTNVSEFKLAEKLDITVNRVRNMFYRLSEHNLVEFTRKKDAKKGWYVYFWTLDMPRVRDLAVNHKQRLTSKLEERIVREETGKFFICPDKHIRVNLENAMEHNFRCPECDANLVADDNTKLINNIKKQIEKLNEEVNLLKELKIKPPATEKTVKPKAKPKKAAKKLPSKQKVKIKKISKKIVKKKPAGKMKQKGKSGRKK